MASDREERRLQRLRGAQSHQIGNLDFGIQINPPARPAIPQLPSGRKTPAGRGRGRPPSSSARSVRQRRRSATPPLQQSTSSTSNNANISVKRRKLDASGVDMPSSGSFSVRSQGRRSVYDLEDDVEDADPLRLSRKTPEPILEEVDELGGEPPVRRTPVHRSVRSLRTPVNAVDEITESPREKPGSGQRRNRNLGETIALGARLQQAIDQHIDAVIGESGTGRKMGGSRAKPNPKTPKQRGRQDVHAGLDELSPEFQDKTRTVERFSDEEAEYEEGVAEEIQDLEAASRLRRKGRQKSPVLDEEEEEVEEEAAEDDVDPLEAVLTPQEAARRGKRSKPKPSPAIQRQGRPPKEKEKPLAPHPKAKTKTASKSQKRKAPETDTEAPSRGKARGSIPISVHRFTKPVNQDEDELALTDMPYIKRSGVNAVDVLSQICEEILADAVQKLEELANEADDSVKRREFVTKLRAVEAFQEELRIWLFDLTTALDASHILSTRLRDAQKTKLRLRAELLRVRAAREEVALEMDAIRAKHQRRSKAAEMESGLNGNVVDIELAVALGRERDAEGGLGDESLDGRDGEDGLAELERLLVVVGAEVSSASREGGVLGRMREFNGFLERAALVLEGRA